MKGWLNEQAAFLKRFGVQLYPEDEQKPEPKPELPKIARPEKKDR